MKVKNITIKNHGTTATLNVLTGKLTFTDNGSLLMREATDDGKGNITLRTTMPTEPSKFPKTFMSRNTKADNIRLTACQAPTR